MAQNTTLTGGVSNAPEGSIQEQTPSKYESENIRIFFDTVTDDTLNFQSQITDNYVENNTAVQDNIALAPITITMNGLCGEKVYTLSDALKAEEDVIKQYNETNRKRELELRNQKLGAIEAYLPKFSNSTAKAQNLYHFAKAAVKKALTVIGTYKSSYQINSQFTQYSGLSSNIKDSKIRECATYLKDAWQSRKAFIARTPFGVFNNMYIQSVTFQQGNENYKADLSITLKQIRFSDVTTTAADQKVLSQYNQLAQAEQQNNGKAKGLKSEAAKIYDGEKGFI